MEANRGLQHHDILKKNIATYSNGIEVLAKSNKLNVGVKKVKTNFTKSGIAISEKKRTTKNVSHLIKI